MHEVMVEAESLGAFCQILEWINDRGVPRKEWDCISMAGSSRVLFKFVDEKLAVLFALKWL